MIQYGQKVVCRPTSFGSCTFGKEDRRELAERKVWTGYVVYVHPEGRYVTVEFKLPGGYVRESFKPWDVEPVGARKKTKPLSPRRP